jgi:hypothetical protein
MDSIYIRFADNGNIRKWSREPFEGGVAYFPSAEITTWQDRYNRKAEEADRLADEKAALAHDLADTRENLAEMADERDAAKGQLAEARGALEKYGRHKYSCARIGGYGYCDCGLEAARALPAEQGEE